MTLLSRLKASFISKNRILKISFIGLDKAGKSSVLKRILNEDFDELNNKRTVGMEVAKFEIAGLQFIAWDIGGQRAFRETVWQTYLQGSKAIIYVIDSTDIKRMQEAKLELERYVFNNNKLYSVPILILANKQDLNASLSSLEIELILNIKNYNTEYIKVFGISCKTGENIQESFDWLCHQIYNSEKKISMNPYQPTFSINV